MPHSLDFMTLVPHDRLRLYVMGERAARGEPANDVDIAMMQALLRQALVDGAAGLAMGSTETHRTAGGNMTPSFEVSPVELNALASVLRDLPYRVIQGISDFASPRGTPEEEQQRFDREYAKLEDMARVANRPISITWMDRVIAPRQSQWLGRCVARERRKGDYGAPSGVTARNWGAQWPRHDAQSPAAFPSYQAISHLPAGKSARKSYANLKQAKILSENLRPGWRFVNSPARRLCRRQL